MNTANIPSIDVTVQHPSHSETIEMFRDDARRMCIAPDGARVAVIGRLYPDARKRRFVWAIRYQAAPGLVNEPSLDGGAKFIAHERASYSRSAT